MLVRGGVRITFGATPLPAAGITAVQKVIFSFLLSYFLKRNQFSSLLSNLFKKIMIFKTFGATPLTVGTTAVQKVVFVLG